MNRKNLLIVVLVLAVFSIGYYFYNQSVTNINLPSTQDNAQPKISSPSPSSINEPEPVHKDWKTITDPTLGVTFQYPQSLRTKYISTQDWPPKIQTIDKPYSCINAGSETAQAGKTEERNINDRKYCITTETQGAAGSMYSQYAYATSFKNNRTIIFTFTFRFVQCANYDDPQKADCEKERQSFNLDELMDEISQTASTQNS